MDRNESESKRMRARSFCRPRMTDILTAISDDKSLTMFSTIALMPAGNDILIRKSGLNRRQYYVRMSSMTKAGLISKRNGKYFVTSFGRFVYDAHRLIIKATENFWKLRAIESFESSDRRMSTEGLSEIVGRLIVEDDLKEIILGCNQVEKSPLAPDQKLQSQSIP